MGDDLTKKKPQDASRINIHEPYELNYWTDKLGVAKAELIAAVGKVGTMVKDVEAHFKNKKK